MCLHVDDLVNSHEKEKVVAGLIESVSSDRVSKCISNDCNDSEFIANKLIGDFYSAMNGGPLTSSEVIQHLESKGFSRDESVVNSDSGFWGSYARGDFQVEVSDACKFLPPVDNEPTKTTPDFARVLVRGPYYAAQKDFYSKCVA